MGPKKKISYITGEGFRGNNELDLRDFQKLAVQGFSPNLLTNLTEDWTGGIAGIIGLSLSNDNRRIVDGRFSIIGSLCQEKKVSANRFWDLDNQISLVFSIADCSIFTFPSGSMVSEVIDSSLVPHRFQEGDITLEQGNLPITLQGFSLKCAVVPSRDTYAKLSLLLFPLAKDRLLALHPLCSNPLFPGISLFSGEFPLIPSSLARPLEKNWGFPFAPAVLPGASFDDLENIPGTEDVRAAMAQILRKAVKPE